MYVLLNLIIVMALFCGYNCPYLLIPIGITTTLYTLKAKKYTKASIFLISAFIICFLIKKEEVNNISSFGLPFNKSTTLYGTIIQDGTLSRSGKVYSKVKFEKIKTDNVTASAKGTGLVFFSNENTELKFLYGTKCIFKCQKNDGNIFNSNNLIHLNMPIFLQKIRASVLLDCRDRIMKPSRWIGYNHEAHNLALMLLFGKTDTQNFELKDKAKKAGCSHILSLSGMHLGIICALFSLLIKKILGKNAQKVFLISIVGTFVFFAGAKPSLIRSFFMFAFAIVFPNKSKYSLIFSFFATAVLFPNIFTEIGFKLSYAATASFFTIFYTLTDTIHKIIKKMYFSSVIASSLGAIILSAPFTILFFGNWNPISILTSPFATVSAYIAIIGGILSLICTGSIISSFLINLGYWGLNTIFNLSSWAKELNTTGYIIFIVAIIILFAIQRMIVNSEKEHIFKRT